MKTNLYASRFFRRGALILVIAAVAVIGAWHAGLFGEGSGTGQEANFSRGQEVDGHAGIGGSFSLTDQNGRTVTDQTLRGRWMLVYFGYTFCPDICPTELQTMSATIKALGALSGRLAPVFVTIDPARDRPAELAAYLAHFDPAITGLTGTEAQISTFARKYHVYYARKGEGKDYSMDHSSYLYLMRPDGSFDRLFPGGMSPNDLAAALRPLLSEAPHP
ncbi:SCO1/SenC family protein [Granulibacter bethesdensis]|uniref:SCO1/SenC family protein n=1 Tax=Granulibacter bethesdensis TaxID=364410 RepID=A0AAC9KAJ2_9PROT|nr:SCO family protein [Granulibacter bethesdensis]APH54144.1 SCO1/SenC family protein [Granulibacter bethesdensis]APH61726.1 SCO1/SenC family protein [Granulibacter bethesdensis]